MTKKTMIAIAALCGAVAFQAKAEIASDIVGYKTTSANTGISQKSAAFDAVASAAVDIQDMKPVVGEGEELYTGGFVIMELTDGGETAESFTFYTAEDAPDGGVAGWFDDAGDRAVKTYAPGEGFVLVSDYENGSLTTSGAVAKEDTVLALGTGINSCGNTMSASITIDQVTVGVGVDQEGNLLATNEETSEEIYTGGLVIMMLTDGGETAESFTYYLAEDAPDGGVAGWFDDAGLRSSKSFDAGEGFIVVSDYNESYIKEPSAL